MAAHTMGKDSFKLKVKVNAKDNFAITFNPWITLHSLWINFDFLLDLCLPVFTSVLDESEVNITPTEYESQFKVNEK